MSSFDIKPFSISKYPTPPRKSFIKVQPIDATDFLQMKSVTSQIMDQMLASNETTFYLDTSALAKAALSIFLKRLFTATYKFDKYVTKPASTKHVYVYDPKRANIVAAEFQFKKSYEIALDLANEPANKTTPMEMAKRVQSIFKNTKAKVTIMDESALKKQGFGLILAVGQGASQNRRPVLVTIDILASAAKKQPLCLVGKGVNIDTGGYELKPFEYMKGQHVDKTGASMVTGLMHWLATTKGSLSRRVIAILPLVENVIGPESVKPKDIVTAYNKQTVEIVSTDAEGRLIMADCFAYAAQKYKPEILFNMATLTGWANMLHCDTSYVFYCESEALTKLIYRSGNEVGERSIRMPPWPEYVKYVKSDVADLKNGDHTGCKKSGGFMAAMFLSAFLPTTLRRKWIHFDVTHTDSTPGIESNCTGFASSVKILDGLV